MNRKPLALALLSFSLVLVALGTRNAGVAWLAVPLVVWLAAGLALLPPASTLRLAAVRKVTLDEDEVTVALSLENQGPRELLLRWSEEPPGPLGKTDPSWEVRLAPRQSTELAYTFTTTRGSYTWETARLVVTDPLGLWETELLLVAPASLRLPPPFHRFRPLALRPARTLSSPGPVPTRQGGSGIDFWGVRDYHSGDPLKRLDWRLSARRPHQFFTRDFTVERTAAVVLILDARSKAETVQDGRSLFEEEVRATSSLAEGFLRQGHRVGLVVYGGDQVEVAPGFGSRQFQRIARALAAAALVDRGPANLEHLPLGRISPLSLLILISPLVAGDERALAWLRRLGYQVCLVRPDSLRFAPQKCPSEIETLAFRMATLERRVQGEFVAQHGVRVVDWRVDEPLAAQLKAALRVHPVAR